MKVKAIKVSGAHTRCDDVYYPYSDDSWSEIDMRIEIAFGDVVDVGDSATIKIEIVEVDEVWLDNLIPESEF